jgi:methyl-accepting chemotaxis protein WspA
VQSSTEGVDGSAVTLRGVTNELQTTIVEQHASTTQIVATTTQIAATAKELASSVRTVNGIARATSQAAGNGMAGLTELETTVQALAVGSQQLVDRLSELNERAGRINSVTSLIGKIADQTNLLSLNAAIEAEKAGELGSGFSVVATEIRRLADRTAVAVLDIESIVKEIQSAVSSSVMTMDQFRQQVHVGVERAGQANHELQAVIRQVTDLSPRFDEVNQGVESQAQAAEQIHTAMLELSHSATQMRTSMEQTKHTADRLTVAVADLTAETRKFKTEDAGHE